MEDWGTILADVEMQLETLEALFEAGEADAKRAAVKLFFDEPTQKNFSDWLSVKEKSQMCRDAWQGLETACKIVSRVRACLSAYESVAQLKLDI